jgi:hypothetical protein
MRRLIAVALLCFPAAVLAQDTTRLIAPGMTRAQVVKVLGPPVTQRSANGHTYMFYRNSCGRGCGMNDLVILKADSVSDAIFRSPDRHYAGTSSSPEETSPSAPQMKPPAKPSDATPSIPVNPLKLPAAPAKTSAPDQKTPG